MIKTEYTVKGPKTITIAVAADLHEHDPEAVLRIIRDVKPDVIAVPGDLFENHEHGENLDHYDRDILSRILCEFIHLADRIAGARARRKQNAVRENAYRFLREAARIAPVVMTQGNHELYLSDEDMAVIRESGAVLINDSCVEISGVRFGGIPSMECTGEIDTGFLRSFADTDRYRVLLCHHPEYYSEISEYADLILSGHCHGGQMRVFGRGVFAPGQGLFPRYHHGIYGKMAVSAGCANTSSIPRIGNPCEVMIVRVREE